MAAPNALTLLMQAMNHPKDPRVIHSSLGAIRNLALAHPNRAKFIEAGIYKDIIRKILVCSFSSKAYELRKHKMQVLLSSMH